MSALGNDTQGRHIIVHGMSLDNETRCKHWHSDKDIIAIRFACCDKFYACYECHLEIADHTAKLWSINEQKNVKAILCGSCHNLMTIHEYQTCANSCPKCKNAFNPGCKNHWHLYFETNGDEIS